MVLSLPLSAIEIQPKIVRKEIVTIVLISLTENIDWGNLQKLASMLTAQHHEIGHLPEKSHNLALFEFLTTLDLHLDDILQTIPVYSTCIIEYTQIEQILRIFPG